MGAREVGSASNAADATQKKDNEVARAVGDKANKAGSVAEKKWEPTKQVSSDAQAASDKAMEAEDGGVSLLQKTGDALGNAVQSAKDAVTSKQ